MEGGAAHASEEAYEAFKTRMLREFDLRQAGQPPSLQQKLLRTHLRDFLLSVGAEGQTQCSESEQDTGASHDSEADTSSGAEESDGTGCVRGTWTGDGVEDGAEAHDGNADQAESWTDGDTDIDAETWTRVDPYAEVWGALDYRAQVNALVDLYAGDNVGSREIQAEVQAPDAQVPDDIDHYVKAETDLVADKHVGESEDGVDAESEAYFETETGSGSDVEMGGDAEAEAEAYPDGSTRFRTGETMEDDYARETEIEHAFAGKDEASPASFAEKEVGARFLAEVENDFGAEADGSIEVNADHRAQSQIDTHRTDAAEAGSDGYPGSAVATEVYVEVGDDSNGESAGEWGSYHEAETRFACDPFDGEHIALAQAGTSSNPRTKAKAEGGFCASIGFIAGHQVDDEVGFAQEPDHTPALAKRKVATRRATREQRRRLALARVAIRSRREHAAYRIQRFLRDHCRNIAVSDTILDDVELLSTTMFIPIVKEPRMHTIVVSEPTDHNEHSLESPPTTLRASPPFEVVVELLAARDLVTGSPSASICHSSCVEAELRLKHQSSDIIQIVARSQRLLNARAGEFSWDNCLLRFAIDPSAPYGVDPQSVIDEWDTHIVVKTSSPGSGRSPTGNNGGPRVLGVVDVPMSLLETPMASQYAMRRWFPLQRAHPGHTARGELRLSVCFLMRAPDTGSAIADGNFGSEGMVPYAPKAKPQTPPKAPEQRRRGDKKTSTRKEIKPPKTASALQNRLGQLSIRPNELKSSTSRCSDEKPVQRSVQDREKSLPSPIPPKTSLSSSTVRISRAEVLSPPSSPSSTSSETGGETTFAIAVDQKTEIRMKSRRQINLPKSPRRFAKPIEVGSTETLENPDMTKEIAGPTQHLRQPFLKRKPYQVVFRKLDWSNVASKTDSNWPTNSAGSGVKKSKAHSQPKKTPFTRALVDSEPKQDENKQTIPNSRQIEASGLSSSECASGKNYIDQETGQRLAMLEKAVLEQCHLTAGTARLAQMKFQSERKKFVAALQKQVQEIQDQWSVSVGDAESESPPQISTEVEVKVDKSDEDGEGGSACKISYGTVTELWRNLAADTSGELYVAMLQSFSKDQDQSIDAPEKATVT